MQKTTPRICGDRWVKYVLYTEVARVERLYSEQTESCGRTQSRAPQPGRMCYKSQHQAIKSTCGPGWEQLLGQPILVSVRYKHRQHLEYSSRLSPP